MDDKIMTGTELVKALLKHKGEVCVAAVMRDDAPYIRAVKSDLIRYFKSIGDRDAGAEFRVSDGIGYVDV